MNVYESLFERQLKKAITDLRATKRETLEGGYPTEFSAYRELVGYLNALRDFDAILKEIGENLNREEEI